MTNQIHVSNAGHVQTFAAVETDDGVTLLSTGGGHVDATMHIPFAARAWAARVVRPAPVVPSIEAMRREANDP
jgi:hypothetical protein